MNKSLKLGIPLIAMALLFAAVLMYRLRQPTVDETLGRERVVRKSDTQSLFSPSEKRRIAADPASFYRQFRLTPRFVDKDSGRIAGADVAFVSPESCLYLGGVREGDHIAEVDSEVVDKVERIMNLAQRIKSGRPLSLGIVRNGQKIPLVLEFR